MRLSLFFASLLAAVSVPGSAVSQQPPGTIARPVATVSGPIRGIEEDGIAVYRGIPYAAPPVGELRWRAPQAPARWTVPRDAFAFSKACPQVGGPIPGFPPEPQSEDCLYLNVWAPTQPSAKPRAVMVWLHGGGNMNGSASVAPYSGHSLAAKDVVVVSLNYRLGALGFLAHKDLGREAGNGASGNYGMMDIIAALKWVKANARAFGGDPANVTVFGHSAGAWNMSQLQVSPLARGLYRRIIAMSGANFGPSGTRQGVAMLPDAEAAGASLATYLQAGSLADLRAIPTDRIVGVPASVWPGEKLTGNLVGIVDGYVIPADPYTLYAAGKANQADLLLGYTSAETDGAQPANAAAYVREVHDRYGDFAERFLAAYPAGSDAEAVQSWQRLTGENVFKWQMTTWARQHAATGRGKVYFYRFSHTPGIGPFRRIGPGHGSEIGYVFDFPKREWRYAAQPAEKAAVDVGLIDTIQSYWVNFARTGDPNREGLPIWPTFGATQNALELGDEVKPVSAPDAAEHRLMDDYMAAERARVTRSSSR